MYTASNAGPFLEDSGPPAAGRKKGRAVPSTTRHARRARAALITPGAITLSLPLPRRSIEISMRPGATERLVRFWRSRVGPSSARRPPPTRAGRSRRRHDGRSERARGGIGGCCSSATGPLNSTRRCPAPIRLIVLLSIQLGHARSAYAARNGLKDFRATGRQRDTCTMEQTTNC